MFSDCKTGRKQSLPLTIIKIILIAVLLVSALEMALRTNVIRLTYGGHDWKDFRTISFNYELSLDRDLLYRIVPSDQIGINSYGYRDSDFHVKRNQSKRILFMGDSFIMGANVASSNTIAKVLEKSLGTGYEVYNMGVHGYGPDQSLVQLREDALQFNPDMVILGIYPANDFNDIIKNRIFSLGPDGVLLKNIKNLVTEEIPDLDVAYLMRYLQYRYLGRDEGLERVFNGIFADAFDSDFIINNDSPASLMKAGLMDAVLRDFVRELRDKGIRPLIVIIPAFAAIQEHSYLDKLSISPEKYFLGEDIVAGMCHKEKIPYINLHEIFRQNQGELIYDPEDRHLSVFGNWLTASIIHNYIVSSNL